MCCGKVSQQCKTSIDVNEDGTLLLYLFISAPEVFIKTDLEILKEHNDPESSRSHCMLSLAIFLNGGNAGFFFTSLSFEVEGRTKSNFITCAHCDFFLCDAENYRLSVEVMYLDDRADWMVLSW